MDDGVEVPEWLMDPPKPQVKRLMDEPHRARKERRSPGCDRRAARAPGRGVHESQGRRNLKKSLGDEPVDEPRDEWRPARFLGWFPDGSRFGA